MGSSRHVAWVLRVIHFGLDALPANPRNRRAIIIGGSIATYLKLPDAMGSNIERFGHATMVRPLGEGVTISPTARLRMCLLSVRKADLPSCLGIPWLLAAMRRVVGAASRAAEAQRPCKWQSLGC